MTQHPVTHPKRPGPGDLLMHAFELFNDRGAEYDNTATMENNMREIAAIATVILGKELTARDITIIQVCTKLIRSRSSPGKLDNYVDAMNYMAFAACTAGLAPLPDLVKPPTPLRPVAVQKADPALPQP